MLGRSSEGIYNEENIRPRLFKRWIGKRYPLNIHYPADKYLGNQLHYPLNRDLSIGLGYPAFEQLGLENEVTVLQKKKSLSASLDPLLFFLSYLETKQGISQTQSK